MTTHTAVRNALRARTVCAYAIALVAGAWAVTPLRAQAQAPDAAPPAASAPVTAPAPAADDSLYLALGSQAGIDRIVDDFVSRLPTDPRLGEFFKKSNLVHLKQMLSQQFCSVSGGACVYTGIPMKMAHQNMDISKGDFNALVEVLQSAMDAQGVPFSTQNKLLARLAPMHRDIVNVH